MRMSATLGAVGCVIVALGIGLARAVTPSMLLDARAASEPARASVVNRPIALLCTPDGPASRGTSP